MAAYRKPKKPFVPPNGFSREDALEYISAMTKELTTIAKQNKLPDLADLLQGVYLFAGMLNVFGKATPADIEMMQVAGVLNNDL